MCIKLYFITISNSFLIAKLFISKLLKNLKKNNLSSLFFAYFAVKYKSKLFETRCCTTTIVCVLTYFNTKCQNITVQKIWKNNQLVFFEKYTLSTDHKFHIFLYLNKDVCLPMCFKINLQICGTISNIL